MRRLGETDLEFLEQLFDAATGIAFFVKDKHLRYVAANKEMARFCGVSRPADIYGKDLRDFFPADIATRYEALDRWVLAFGLPSKDHFDLTMSGKGEPVWAHFSRIPLKARGGETMGVAAVAQRLTYGEEHHALYCRVSAVAQHVRKHPTRPLDLHQLSQIAGVSTSQLQRDFKRMLGKSLRSFQHQIRVEQALQLLAQGRPVVEVAYACGYADHSAFTRRFRQVMGMSPSAFR